MTVTTSTTRSNGTGDGATLTFPFTFALQQATDIQVYVAGVLKTLNTDYTVTPAGGLYPSVGGNIVFMVAPANLSALLFVRIVDQLQTVDLQTEADLPSSTMENVYDKATMQLQQLQEQLNRAFVIPITTSGVSTAVPAPTATTAIGWNAAGNALVNYTPQAFLAGITGIGSGNVVGPSPTVVGEIALFNNTTGTLLSRLSPGTAGNVATSNGSIWTSAALNIPQGFTQLRCYLVSGQPEADGSGSGNGTIYVGPYKGNLVSADNGSGVLSTIVLTEKSAVLSVTSGLNYSVYLVNTAGVFSVSVVQDWTGATPPTYQTDALGRACKNGSKNQLLVATFQASGTNLTSNWAGGRYLANEYNLISVPVFAQDTTTNWTYASATVRAANGSTTDGIGRVSIFTRNNKAISLTCFCGYSNNTAFNGGVIGIGINSTTVMTVSAASTVSNAGGLSPNLSVSYAGTQATGLTTYQRLEAVTGNICTFWYTLPVAPSTNGMNGLVGTVMN